MDPKKSDQRDGTYKIFGIQIEYSYLNPNYEIITSQESNILENGLLTLFEIKPLNPTLPSFRARWDEKKNLFDIDLIGKPEEQKLFKEESGGFLGHHTKKIAEGAHIYEIDIQLPNQEVCRAKVSFGLNKIMHLEAGIHRVTASLAGTYVVRKKLDSEWAAVKADMEQYNDGMQNPKRKLRLYIKVVRSLQETRFIKSTTEIGVRNTTGQHKKMRLKPYGYSEEQLRSALIDFRKLMLEKEQTNFYLICNSIEKGEFSASLKEETRLMRKEFSGILNREITAYDHRTKDKPKDVVDKWINGYYFHQEPDKSSSLNRMGFIKHVHKLVFVATVLDLTRIAIRLADIIELELRLISLDMAPI